jgi:hypothetical protein
MDAEMRYDLDCGLANASVHLRLQALPDICGW